MSKKLYKFEMDCGYGEVRGLFVEDEEVVNNAIGKELAFGEILGKWEPIGGPLEEDDLEILVSDKEEWDKKMGT